MSNPIFRLGDLVYAHTNSYTITSMDNAYVGIVVSLPTQPHNILTLMNFHCSKYDTFRHMWELPFEDISFILDSLHRSTSLNTLPRFPGKYTAALGDLFPEMPLTNSSSRTKLVNIYDVIPERFTPLTLDNLPRFMVNSTPNFPRYFNPTHLQTILRKHLSPFPSPQVPRTFL